MNQLPVQGEKKHSLLWRMLAGAAVLFAAATVWCFKRWYTAIAYIFIAAFFALWLFFATPFLYWFTTETVEFTVTSAAPAFGQGVDGNMQRKLMVYARDVLDDGETKPSEAFENEDLLWCWKYRSSDLQAILVPEHRFRGKVTGFRVSLPGMHYYRILLSAEEIPIAKQPEKSSS